MPQHTTDELDAMIPQAWLPPTVMSEKATPEGVSVAPLPQHTAVASDERRAHVSLSLVSIVDTMPRSDGDSCPDGKAPQHTTDELYAWIPHA